MTHPLSGFASVEESARLLRNYRYAVERMMRILGGWIALTPELSAKLLLGRHVWDNAQHADAFGRRLPELRARAHVSEPASPAFVAFMDAIEEPGGPSQTVERLVGVYRVLKPHLLAAYEEHLARANAVYEPPTRRILAGCAADERRHIAAGLTVLRHLVTPPLEERARAWHARLDDLLATSGGVTGLGPAAGVPVEGGPTPSLSDDAQEFIRLERSATGWALPEDLEPVIHMLGDALIGRDPAGPRRWLLPGAVMGEGVELALTSGGMSAHRIVAVAKVGRQRLVKVRLEGPADAVTLSVRWVLGEGGWRAAALDLVAVDSTRRA